MSFDVLRDKLKNLPTFFYGSVVRIDAVDALLVDFEKTLKKKAFYKVRVWVVDSPRKPIPKLKGATKQDGHFEEKQAILLEDLLLGDEKDTVRVMLDTEEKHRIKRLGEEK